VHSKLVALTTADGNVTQTAYQNLQLQVQPVCQNDAGRCEQTHETDASLSSSQLEHSSSEMAYLYRILKQDKHWTALVAAQNVDSAFKQVFSKTNNKKGWFSLTKNLQTLKRPVFKYSQ